MAQTHEHREKDGDGDKKGDRTGESGRDRDIMPVKNYVDHTLADTKKIKSMGYKSEYSRIMR